MATPISASPPISRTRLRSAAAMSSGRKAPMSKPRDTVEIATRPRSWMLAQHRDDAMQRLGRGLLVVHHGDADVVRAGIAAVELLARAIAARQHAHPALAPESR